MQRASRLITLIVILGGLQLTACSPAVTEEVAVEHIRIVPIEGSDLKQEILSEEAAQRLDIQTVATTQEQAVRKRVVGGEILDKAAPDPNMVYIRIHLSADDLDQIDRTRSALVMPLDSDSEQDGLTAEEDVSQEADDGEDVDTALYFKVDNSTHNLAAKQQVFVQLTLKSSDQPQTVVPYAAIVYDTTGATWVYTSPEPLTFIRTPVTVDYIDGDKAILSQGPAIDTAVVSVGAEELYGAEFEFEEE